MINIPVAEFVIVLLIFMRIFAAFTAAPVYGNTSIPVLARIFLSLVIAYIVFLTLSKSNIHVEFTLGWLFANAAKEIITGLIIGFMLNFIFYAVSYSGSLIGIEMGLSMSDVLNPIDGTESNLIGEGLYYGTLLMFLLINGHQYIISGLVYSFSVIHLGKFTVTTAAFNLMVKYTGMIFIIAVKIASPIIVSYILVYVALGIITRVIPQMQVFFVAQPLMIGLGFVLLTAMVPVYFYVVKSLLRGYETNLVYMIKAMGQ